MKAELHEYEHGFSLELAPETIQEHLRVVRLGLLTRKGSRMYVSVGKEAARLSFRFLNNKKASTYIRSS